MDVVYYTIALSMGIVVAFFSIRIYMLARDKMLGCKYIGISGIAMTVWSVSGVVYDIFQTPDIYVIWIGIAVFAVVSTVAPIGAIKLAKDGGFGTRLLTARNFAIYYLSILTVLLAYNLLSSPVNIPAEIYSVMQMMIFFGFIPMAYGFLVLWRGAGKTCWMLLLLFTIMIAITQPLSMYVGGCCGQGGMLESDLACLEYTNHYVEIIPLPCSVEAVATLFGYNNIEIAAFMVAIAALFFLWKTISSAPARSETA